MSEFISLYSGSSGNCSVVRTGEKYIIIDMGKGVRTTSAALKELGLNISDCAGILVTHEHSDHVKGLATFLKKNPLPVYGADDTLDFLDANGIVPATCELRTLSGGEAFKASLSLALGLADQTEASSGGQRNAALCQY